jgi:hypothetical protein
MDDTVLEDKELETPYGTLMRITRSDTDYIEKH